MGSAQRGGWRRRVVGAAAATLLVVYAVAAVAILPETFRPSRPAARPGPQRAPPVIVHATELSVAAAPSLAPPDSAALEHDAIARFAHGPLARVLGRRVKDPRASARIARALVREATRLQVAPSLLAGVLITENARLEPHTVSSQGAIGLMQVMPFHAGEYGCVSNDLRDIDGNICHGASVLGHYLGRTSSLKRALLRYNGCVTSANTPNCHRYPAKVLRTASLVRQELLRDAELRTAVLD